MDPPDDPIYDAERQMIEHELGLYRRLMSKHVARMPLDFDHPPNDDEIKARLEELIAEDPEALDIAERLSVMMRFRRGE
jgi:hypothetical protein